MPGIHIHIKSERLFTSPGIRNKRPDQLGCAALAHSSPQLLFTNLAVASAMLGAFYAYANGMLKYEEIFLDIVQAKVTPVQRGILGGRSLTSAGTPHAPRQAKHLSIPVSLLICFRPPFRRCTPRVQLRCAAFDFTLALPTLACSFAAILATS